MKKLAAAVLLACLLVFSGGCAFEEKPLSAPDLSKDDGTPVFTEDYLASLKKENRVGLRTFHDETGREVTVLLYGDELQTTKQTALSVVCIPDGEALLVEVKNASALCPVLTVTMPQAMPGKMLSLSYGGEPLGKLLTTGENGDKAAFRADKDGVYCLTPALCETKAGNVFLSADAAVTLSYRTDTDELADVLPRDGYLMHPEQVSFEAGESAFDLFVRTMKGKKISVVTEFTPGTDVAYVVAVGGVNAGGNDGMNGWIYLVNGEIPLCSANEYILKDGDIVSFRFSSSFGADLGISMW